jgi:excisionase family DNA binding protein
MDVLNKGPNFWVNLSTPEGVFGQFANLSAISDGLSTITYPFAIFPRTSSATSLAWPGLARVKNREMVKRVSRFIKLLLYLAKKENITAIRGGTTMKNQIYLTVPETAKRLKCTTKYVYDLLYSGAIEAKKYDGRWQIPDQVVNARLAKKVAK